MGRYPRITALFADGGIEVEEEFDSIDLLPRYTFGLPYPVEYVEVPAKETRRRAIYDQFEAESLVKQINQARGGV